MRYLEKLYASKNGKIDIKFSEKNYKSFRRLPYYSITSYLFLAYITMQLKLSSYLVQIFGLKKIKI